MAKKNPTKFFSVRPALVSEIIQAGGSVTEVPNALNPSMHAWSIDLDDTSIEVIREFYAERDLPLPKQITSFIDRQEVDA